MDDPPKCPNDPDGRHLIWDHTYWGMRYPTCSLCGYEDVSRALPRDFVVAGTGSAEQADEMT